MQTQQLCKSLQAACNKMPEHTQTLCMLDTGIGDGDHGVTAERGFITAAQAIDAYKGHDASELFSIIGEQMAQSMGGSIGPLYGVYWRAFSEALHSQELTCGNIGEALMAGCMQVMRLGKAGLGYKTVVDAMHPCAVAALEGTGTLAGRVQRGAEAAMRGAEGTKDMVAKKGRARFLFEKSMGHVDAGAYSFALFMDHWAWQMTMMELEDSQA